MVLNSQGSMYIKVPQRAVHTKGKNHQVAMKIGSSISNGVNESFCVSSAYSMAFWIQQNGTPVDDGYLFCKGSNSDGFPMLMIDNDGGLDWWINATDKIESTTAGTLINDSKWHHIVATFDRNVASNHLNLYVDGNLTDALTATEFSPDMNERNTLIFCVSTSTVLTQCFSGNCSNFQFWSGTALDSDEVKRVYNGIPVTEKRVCEFRFDDPIHGYDAGVSWDTTETISGNWGEAPEYVDRDLQCWCGRWDEGNWDVQVETILNASDRNFLFQNVTPGAVRELYNILGTPKYIDTTYSSSNTLILEPISGYGLSSLRQRRIIGVKSIGDTFFNKEIFSVKIDGMRLEE